MGSTDQQPTNGGPDLSHLGYSPIVKVSEPWTVEKVLEKIDEKPREDSKSALSFLHMLERLKTTKREGWRRFGIQRGESISDHMYRMSLISMFAPVSLRPKLDLYKCMRMCLIHDMAELLVGDITPVDGVPKPEKNRREAATMDYLTKNLLRGVPGGPDVGDEIRSIWQEYEDSQTLDSHFVHDVDKIELLLQMVEYEKKGDGKLDLGEFAYVSRKMTLPEMQTWGEEIIREREEFWGSVNHIHGEKGVEGGIREETRAQQEDYYQRS
ncbi:HD domain-containing protein [Emericellopsis atlantica]|uniref:5'-deoxynucleotidase n=1 Tax=Emericellopsis atlantica TaxID=2614577 RepID=A0A9P7ZID3_9HYPO|nr:HD domain-containing protein [Emericellopsis atlantica]KAG9252664.1 HD domain-containing protein [Emericellopsis atlantica]